MLSSGSILSRSLPHKNPAGSEDIGGRKSPGLGGPERIPSLKSGQRFVSNWKSIPLKQPKRSSLGFSNAIPVRFFDGQLRTLQRRVRDWRREQLYKAEITRVEPTTSEIGSQSLPVAPPESRETGPAPVALRAPSPRPVVSEARNQ